MYLHHLIPDHLPYIPAASQVHERNNLLHVCPDCGKALSSKTALVLHERTHTGTKPFQCSDCGARFTQNSALKMHRRYGAQSGRWVKVTLNCIGVDAEYGQD